MVNKDHVKQRRLVKMATLQDLLNEKQLLHIIKQATGTESGLVIAHKLRPAAEGLTGFLGDHFKLTLHVKQKECVKILHLFVKCMPLKNKAKAEFIEQANFYRREALMFNLFEQMGGDDGPNQWRAKAYLYTDDLLIMPDMSVQGYVTQPYYDTLDLPHILITAASIARFHAGFANFSVKNASNGNRFYNILDDYECVMKEPTFCDSDWLRGCGKVSTEILKAFSTKYNDVPNLEEQIKNLYVNTCDNLKVYSETINVLLHRDLWANNILFKHENGVPINALLIDFQCLRFGPPAFDLTMFLYLTSSRSCRELHEREILEHYFKVFWDCLEDATKLRLKEVNYCFDELLRWFEKARQFGMLMAISIFPYVLMDPVAAKRTFDDPETFDRYLGDDRSIPVLEQCRRCRQYKERQLQVTEEFVHRYLVDKL